jgi:fluoride exporter
MKTLIEYMAVGAAGFFGAMLRFLITRVSGAMFNTDFPVGTMIINLTGSLFLGWFWAVTETRIMLSDPLKLAIGVGFVGAYTTFSTFCLDSTKLLDGGAYNKFAFNVIGSVVLGLLAVRLGMRLAGR